MADGTVKISTELDTDKLQSALSGLGKTVAVGLGAATAAIGAFSVKALKAMSGLEQNVGGSEAVFKEFASTVQQVGADAYSTMGLAQSEFLATANKMGALMQGSGLEIETSMTLSTQAMQRAADVASIMGIDVGFAMESVAGAAKGNFTMMDNLGVAMNATTLEAYALSKGIDTSYASMDNATKVQLAMEMFLEKTTYAAGNYAKENETLAGSLNTAQAAMSNFMSGAGDVDSVVGALSNLGDVLIKNISELAPRLASGVGEIVSSLAPKLPTMLNALLPPVVEGGVALITGLAKAIIDNLPMIIATGKKIVIALAEGLTDIAPMFAPVTAVITFFITNIERIAFALAPAIAAFIAFKTAASGAMIISNLSTTITAATAVLGLFTAGATAATVAQTTGATAATILGTVMAVLTGKTTLAAAATALLGIAQAALPFVAVIAGVVALGVAIAAAIVWMRKKSAEAERLSGELEAVEAANEDLRASIESSEQAHRNNIKEIDNEAKANQNLVDQLYSLANGEEASAESKARIVGLVSALNSSMPQLNLLYDEQTNTLNREKGAVDGLIASQQTRLTLQAHEERAVEIAKERVAIEEQLAQIAATRASLDAALASGLIDQSEYNTLLADSIALETDLTSQLESTSAAFDYHTERVAEAESAMDELSQVMTSSGETIDEIAEKYGTTAEAISEALDGVGGSLDGYVAAQEAAADAVSEALEKQRERAEDVYSDITSATDKYSKKTQLSYNEVVANIKANNEAWATYNKNMAYLTENGMGEISALYQQLGPDLNGAINTAIATGDFSALQEALRQGSQTAVETSAVEMGVLPEDFSKTVSDTGAAVAANTAITDAVSGNILAAVAAGRTHQGDLIPVGKMFSGGLAQGITQGRSQAVTAAINVATAALNAAKRTLDVRSPSHEMAWVGEMFDLGFAGGIKDNADKPITAAKDIAKAVYSAAVDYLDEQKYYGKLTLAEELSSLKELEEHFADYGEQREEIARDIYKVEQEIAKKVSALQDNYFDAVDDRAKDIFKSFKLFEELPEPEIVSGTDLMQNLQDQVDAISHWRENIAALSETDINIGLIEELRKMGPEANAELDALLALSDEDLQTYSDLYGEKQRLANEQAILELENLRADVNEQITALTDDAAALIGEESPAIGTGLGNGFIVGLDEILPKALSAVAAFGKKILSTFQSSTQVASPSKFTIWVAEMLGEGVVVGLDHRKGAAVKSAKEFVNGVKAQMQELQTAISADKLAIAAGSSAMGAASRAASAPVVNVAAPNVNVQNNLSADAPTRGFFQMLNTQLETTKYLDGGAPA